MLEHKREARLIILEKLVRVRNELIELGMPHTELDLSIKLVRKRVGQLNKKIFKRIVDSKKG